MKTLFTPLKLWIWVVFLFILLQSVVILYFYKINDKQVTSNNNQYFNQINYLHQEFETDTTSFKVAIIGSSLIGYGVECTNEIENYLNRTNKSNIKLVKIWAANDPLKRFFQLNLVEEIIKSKPDLVLLQTELAAINFKKKENLFPKLSYINTTVVRNLFFKNKKTKLKTTNNCYPEGVNKQVKFDSIHHIPLQRKIKNIESIEYIFKGLAKLKDANIKTIIVDIPKPKKTEKAIYTKLFKENLNTLLKTYNENFDIKYWAYKGTPFYYKHCCDEAHYNKEGRSIYTKWLISNIEKEK